MVIPTDTPVLTLSIGPLQIIINRRGDPDSDDLYGEDWVMFGYSEEYNRNLVMLSACYDDTSGVARTHELFPVHIEDLEIWRDEILSLLNEAGKEACFYPDIQLVTVALRRSSNRISMEVGVDVASMQTQTFSAEVSEDDLLELIRQLQHVLAAYPISTGGRWRTNRSR